LNHEHEIVSYALERLEEVPELVFLVPRRIEKEQSSPSQ